MCSYSKCSRKEFLACIVTGFRRRNLKREFIR